MFAYPNKAVVPSPAFDTVLSVPSLHFLHEVAVVLI